MSKKITLSALTFLLLTCLGFAADPVASSSGPSLAQVAKLIVGDGEGDSNSFGWSVSVDGDTVLLGAPNDGDSGAAYVFVREGESWSQQAKLIVEDQDRVLFNFGWSVSLDGDTALIGATDGNTGFNPDPPGYAYVFVREGGSWSQQAELRVPDGMERQFFGGSVSLDGDTALIGTAKDEGNEDELSGSAYVFVRNGTNWSLEQKLTASDGAENNAWFGMPVSLDGDTALIGNNRDSAYVFVRNGSSWSEEQKLTANDGRENALWGFSSSVSLDGDTALIGAPDDDDNGDNSGSAYVFVRNGTSWSQEQKLTASDGAEGDGFGQSVSLDGDTALVGAPDDDDNGDESGSAYVFVRNGTIWSQEQKLTASDGAEGEGFGYFVSLDGDTALINAPFLGGEVYVFEPQQTTAVEWYSEASELDDGWLFFDWFKGFKPRDENWIFHGRHGWLYAKADNTSRMFLWDGALGRWMFTNATVYPWMYAYGPDEGWVFFFEGGRPGSRYFKRGGSGEVISEQQLGINP